MCSCWLSPFRGVSCSTICKSVFGRVSVCCIASVWVVPAAPAATTAAAAVLFVVVACMLCAVGCAGTPAPACAEPRVFCGGCIDLVAGARRWMTFAVLLFVTADPCLLVRAMTLAWLPGWCKPLQFLSPARVCNGQRALVPPVRLLGCAGHIFVLTFVMRGVSCCLLASLVRW